MQQVLHMSGKRNFLSHWNFLLTTDICRIPIGYWSIPLTDSDTSVSISTAPYVSGAWTFFLRALVWAKKHNVRVIVDLHGAPGSQNGYDNSGQRTGNPLWAVNPDNVMRTVDTLRFLAKEVGDQVDVIELLNEAAGFRGDDWAAAVRSFWVDAYDAVRQAAGEDVKIMIGDAFLGVNVSLQYGSSTKIVASLFICSIELDEFFNPTPRGRCDDGFREFVLFQRKTHQGPNCICSARIPNFQ
jgi:aryl-phospho-beta-D-glucosidase BglC (GH1 family)